MKVINITPSVKVIEHAYHANNHICIDYAVMYTRNNEERFCGYYRSIPTEQELDFEKLNKAYEQNAQIPAWICTK